MKTNTRLNSLIRVEKFEVDAQSQIFLATLEHRLCGGRRLCATSSYQPSVTMSYKILSVTSVGQDTYNVLIQYTGVLSYLPYGGNCCNPCPRTETLFGFINAPVYATGTAPTIASLSIDTTGSTPIVTPIVDDCNPITNDIITSTVFTLNK
ncbi:MAG: hypothetical protein R3Y39_08570 [Rikenellaceae bacterium]